MKRTDATRNVANLFDPGNPAAGIKGTVVDYTWLNSVQEELVNTLMGLNPAAVLDPTNANLHQIWDALSAALALKADVSAIPTEVPTGAVVAASRSTVPAGWLECNGAAVSTTTYAALYAYIGTAYGSGAGTFNLPDYRGKFLRGWDHGRGVDPDAAARTNRGDGITGDRVGTLQADGIKSHTHPSAAANSGLNLGSGGTTFNVPVYGTATGAAGGNETRPANINVMYIIKY